MPGEVPAVIFDQISGVSLPSQADTFTEKLQCDLENNWLQISQPIGWLWLHKLIVYTLLVI